MKRSEKRKLLKIKAKTDKGVIARARKVNSKKNIKQYYQEQERQADLAHFYRNNF